MPSISSRSTRRAPQQERAEKRIAGFLEAAEALFAEVGYEAASMTAVAERSGSSIGALYNYFPDKQALAFALVTIYGQQLEIYWKPLMDAAAGMSVRRFSGRFLEIILEFAREHPAYFALVVAPIRIRRDAAAKRALRETIAGAFRTKNPQLTQAQAMLATNVSLQMVRGMMVMYTEASATEKPLVEGEFKRALSLYLGSVLVSTKKTRS